MDPQGQGVVEREEVSLSWAQRRGRGALSSCGSGSVLVEQECVECRPHARAAPEASQGR